MENASKALIIAGAILLSILLVSLGIMVYTQAKGTVNDADLSSEEVQTFNNKFTTYSGTQTGSTLNALMDAVASSNGTKSLHPILVHAKGGASSAVYWGKANTKVTPAGEGEISPNKTNSYPNYSRTDSYVVSFKYDANGYVCVINIAD